MEHNDCYHRIVECIEELPLLQGSKYIYSDMEGIHKKIASYLREGRLVLFSGLPCQVAGVNSFFKENKNKQIKEIIDKVEDLKELPKRTKNLSKGKEKWKK